MLHLGHADGFAAGVLDRLRYGTSNVLNKASVAPLGYLASVVLFETDPLRDLYSLSRFSFFLAAGFPFWRALGVFSPTIHCCTDPTNICSLASTGLRIVVDHVILLIVLEYAKVNQLCLVALFFYAFVAQVLGQRHLVQTILWPVHGIIVLILTGVTAYSIATGGDYGTACEAPGWLAMSILACILGFAFLALAIFFQRKVRTGPGHPPMYFFFYVPLYFCVSSVPRQCLCC